MRFQRFQGQRPSKKNRNTIFSIWLIFLKCFVSGPVLGICNPKCAINSLSGLRGDCNNGIFHAMRLILALKFPMRLINIFTFGLMRPLAIWPVFKICVIKPVCILTIFGQKRAMLSFIILLVKILFISMPYFGLLC